MANPPLTSWQPCRKENLWPHLREFADRGIAHCKNMLVRLTEAHTPCELFAVHGHYADAGECAAMMASTLGVDMVMTGHSLGRNKLEHLLASGEPPRHSSQTLVATVQTAVMLGHSG